VTAFVERVPVDRITTRARDAHFGRTILTLIAAVLYALGWLVATVLSVLWLTITWSVTAVRVGWEDARTPKTELVEPPPRWSRSRGVTPND
jgi:hypothetical protein